MIQVKENVNYLNYANTLFSYFKGLREGQGCFLMRTLRGKFSGLDQRDYLDCLYKVLLNLCCNGFLSLKDIQTQYPLEGWINLTEKGYDYMQGGHLIVNKVDFNHYILLSDSDIKQFDDLWVMIGDEAKAPFYIKGPTYLNMIRPYLSEYLSNYLTYMSERQKNGMSTSRRIWYKELFMKVPPIKRAAFLDDLSYAVSISFYYKEERDEECLKLLDNQLEELTNEVNNSDFSFPTLEIAKDNKRQTPEELLAISIELCDAYKSLIENNRMYRLLYNDDGTQKDETAAQLLFYSIAKMYCERYDVDLNRESDPGIGELDFKLSVGCSSKVVIEMKLSSNLKLQHGYEKQLPAYLRAEETKYGIFLVLQMNKTIEPQLLKIQDSNAQSVKKGDTSITLLCVDATPKPSASKI